MLTGYFFFEAVGAGPFPAFAASHLAFIIADSLAFTAGDIGLRFCFAGALGAVEAGAAAGAFSPLIFAQRAC